MNHPLFEIKHARRYLLCSAIACLLLLSCITYEAPNTDPPRNEPISVLSRDFDYAPDPIPPQVGTPKSEGRYTITEIAFHAEGQRAHPDPKNPFIRTKFYRPNGPGPWPAVVILPITRGDYPTKAIAAYLADRGIASLLFLSRSTFTGNAEKDFATLAAQIHDYVVEIRQALDWLTQQSSIDSSRIGLVGMSLGAIAGSLAVGVDPRIRSEVLLLSGGDLPGILFSTRERSFVKMRNRLMAERKLNAEALKLEAAKTLARVEPLDYAKRLPASRILMINAYFDKTIPGSYTLALWEKIGKPHLILVPTGHYTAILFLWYAEAMAYEHFKKTLGLSVPVNPLSRQKAEAR